MVALAVEGDEHAFPPSLALEDGCSSGGGRGRGRSGLGGGRRLLCLFCGCRCGSLLLDCRNCFGPLLFQLLLFFLAFQVHVHCQDALGQNHGQIEFIFVGDDRLQFLVSGQILLGLFLLFEGRLL